MTLDMKSGHTASLACACGIHLNQAGKQTAAARNAAPDAQRESCFVSLESPKLLSPVDAAIKEGMADEILARHPVHLTSKACP